MPRRRSAPELALERALKAEGDVPRPEMEFRFHPTRKWLLDFAWPAERLGVEVQGGTFVEGAHTRGAGYQSDCHKKQEAILLGWRVLEVTPQDITDGRAVAVIRQALGLGPTRRERRIAEALRRQGR